MTAESSRAWKERNRERTRAYFRDLNIRRRRFLATVKETCGCVDCGTTSGRLDFDHRPGTEKLFGVSGGARRSLLTLIVEIEKCDVRCASCHTKRHWADGKTLPEQDRFGFLPNRAEFVGDLREAASA